MKGGTPWLLLQLLFLAQLEGCQLIFPGLTLCTPTVMPACALPGSSLLLYLSPHKEDSCDRNNNE